MKKVFIIAEAGVNHNGSLATAKRLIDAAAAAGCDAVKFQTFIAEKITSRDAPRASYQKKNTGSSGSQYEMLKGLELSEKEHKALYAYCRRKGIIFMSTPFDEESVGMLSGLGMRIFKIASGEITNKPLIEKIASERRPVILSTGMSYMGEVEKAVGWIRSAWKNMERKPRITVLHCVSDYPASYAGLNLHAMAALGGKLGLPFGFSDHTPGIEASVAACALGASVIEKHFTLSRKMKGPDHKASLEPDELSALVKAVRNIEIAMGDGVKRPTAAEQATKRVARKGITAARDIAKGAVIRKRDLCVKRPAAGIDPEHLREVIGSKAKARIKKDSAVKSAHIMKSRGIKR